MLVGFTDGLASFDACCSQRIGLREKMTPRVLGIYIGSFRVV